MKSYLKELVRELFIKPFYLLSKHTFYLIVAYVISLFAFLRGLWLAGVVVLIVIIPPTCYKVYVGGLWKYKERKEYEEKVKEMVKNE